MNANDLPPAAKLAALIETGRAANPDLTHGCGAFLHGDNSACALGFAALAGGASRKDLGVFSGISQSTANDVFEEVIGMRFDWTNLLGAVATLNDHGTPLDDICASLREGALAKITA